MKDNYLNENNDLIGEIEKAIVDLKVALNNYDNAIPDLVDYYSYQIKAAEAKFDYLLKQTKDMNLSKFKKII